MRVFPAGVFNTTYGAETAILRTRWQWTAFILAIAALLALPPLFAGDYWLSQLTRIGILIVAVLGLHLLTGLCGQVSMGQAAFMGVGSYAAAVLAMKANVNPWLCLPICAILAGLTGAFFGLPCLRLKGFYLAISTMAASFIIIWIFQHLDMTGRFSGMGLDPLHLGSIKFVDAPLYILTMVVMLLATVFAKNLQRTAPGRAFVAIRDNESAAEVSGIPVFRYKMLAFFVGSAYAGVAGWLWAYSQMWVNPEQFPMNDSLWYIGMLIIGGWGSTTGVFLGVISLQLLGVVISDYVAPSLAQELPDIANQIRVSLSVIVYGAVIGAFVMFQPHGLYALWQRLVTSVRLFPYGHSE